MKRSNLLLLGGTREAVWLAEKLSKRATVTYSLAGRTQNPNLPASCTIRQGGFGGINGLIEYLDESDNQLVIDATHPFAEQISQHAILACKHQKIPYKAYQRPIWQALPQDNWVSFSKIDQVINFVEHNYDHILVTLGSRTLQPLQSIKHCRLILRMVEPCIDAHHWQNQGHIVLCQRPPYTFEQERQLIDNYTIQCILMRNSGGKRPAKLDIAAQLGLQVVMLDPPKMEHHGDNLDVFFNQINQIMSIR